MRRRRCPAGGERDERFEEGGGELAFVLAEEVGGGPVASQAGLVDEAQLFALAAEGDVRFGGKRRQAAASIRRGRGRCGRRFRPCALPRTRARRARAKPSRRRRRRAFRWSMTRAYSWRAAQIAAVDLREGDVEVAASESGRPADEVEVLRGEEDGAYLADDLRRASGGAVDAESLAGAGGDGLCAVEAADRHFDADGAGEALGFGDDAGDGRGLGVPVDEVAIGGRAGGADRRQEVDGFEEVGLALGVLAEEQQEAGRRVELQAAIVAEVVEGQAA